MKIEFGLNWNHASLASWKILLSALFISPEESTHLGESLECIGGRNCLLSAQGSCFTIGDFNAWTANESDFIDHDSNNLSSPPFRLHPGSPFTRTSQDAK